MWTTTKRARTLGARLPTLQPASQPASQPPWVLLLAPPRPPLPTEERAGWDTWGAARRVRHPGGKRATAGDTAASRGSPPGHASPGRGRARAFSHSASPTPAGRARARTPTGRAGRPGPRGAETGETPGEGGVRGNGRGSAGPAPAPRAGRQPRGWGGRRPPDAADRQRPPLSRTRTQRTHLAAGGTHRRAPATRRGPTGGALAPAHHPPGRGRPGGQRPPRPRAARSSSPGGTAAGDGWPWPEETPGALLSSPPGTHDNRATPRRQRSFAPLLLSLASNSLVASGGRAGGRRPRRPPPGSALRGT